MKKKIIITMLVATMLTVGATNAYATNPLDGYDITIYDQATPATLASGKDWPITTWYFFDADHNVLGSITGNDFLTIAHEYQDETPDGNWELWFPEVFNNYRGLSNSSPSDKTKQDFDSESLAIKVINLTNSERKEHGLNPLEVDEELMKLAQTRAEEVSTKYSHERPDGTTVVELGCGENVGAKASAEKQVKSWMNSDGHRHNILLDRYKTIGVGCHKADNGSTYWVQVFKP